MVIGAFFMLLGAAVLTIALLWQSGRSLDSARWIARNTSVHVVYATPMAGLLVACLGLSIIWPPAIVLVFLAAGAFLFMLLASPHWRRARANQQTVPSMGPPRRQSTTRPETARNESRRAS
jgi:hypothetical protein